MFDEVGEILVVVSTNIFCLDKNSITTEKMFAENWNKVQTRFCFNHKMNFDIYTTAQGLSMHISNDLCKGKNILPKRDIH